jgi:hypothetical protein
MQNNCLEGCEQGNVGDGAGKEKRKGRWLGMPLQVTLSQNELRQACSVRYHRFRILHVIDL